MENKGRRNGNNTEFACQSSSLMKQQSKSFEFTNNKEKGGNTPKS